MRKVSWNLLAAQLNTLCTILSTLSLASFPVLVPSPRSQSSFPVLVPSPHSQSSFPVLVPSPRSQSLFHTATVTCSMILMVEQWDYPDITCARKDARLSPTLYCTARWKWGWGPENETNSLFTLAWNGYEPVHGIVLKNGSPPFTLATIIGVSIIHAASSPADACCHGYSFISAWVKFKGTNCRHKTVTLERFCLY